MLAGFEIVTTLLVAVAMATAIAHALELPGKRRLPRETYLAVQHIYYPGFTIAGLIGEAGGFVLVLVLLLLTSPGSSLFWLVLVALLGICGMQAVYWVVTHPTNKYWMRGEDLEGLGSAFFSAGPGGGIDPERVGREKAWMQLRDRWEYSHVARAGFAVMSFVALLIALRAPS